MASARRNGPAYLRVAQRIREQILAGEMVPGSRLPAEGELSEVFNVSRSTVREALRVVASQSLVRTRRGVQGGTFVATPEPAEMSDYLEGSLGMLANVEDVDVAQLLEARALLEAPAAGLAARRRTAVHRDQLRASMAEGQQRRERGFEDNRSFHETVLEAAGNPLLVVLTRPIFTVLRERFLRDQAPASFWVKVGRDHERILRAIDAGDAEAAEAHMRTHLRHLAVTYRRIDRTTAAGKEG